MKFLILIPDGSADRPLGQLNDRTPLQAAATPNLDYLAARGTLGLVRTIPAGFPAGSDVANMCVMGYDPHIYYTGRAPLEAASLGISLSAGDVAFRCNLVCVENGQMADFSAGHIDTVSAQALIDSLAGGLGSKDVSFFPGLSYRHIMVAHGRGLSAVCTPPHDISGQAIEPHLPRGEDSDWLQELMSRSVSILSNHPVNTRRRQEGKAAANMIWLWGQGKAPSMPTLTERFGLSGAVISAVDLVKGLGVYAGLEVIEVPGATGWLDTDYRAKAEYALKSLDRHDFVYLHVEAPDEASHSGDVTAKTDAIARFDSEVVKTVLAGLDRKGSFRILVMPDHATPLDIRTHSDEPVPFVLFDSAEAQTQGRQIDAARRFDEKSAASTGLIMEEGWTLLDRLIEKART